MNDDEKEWLRQTRERCERATPGPWYSHATDDEVFMNARYVGLDPGDWPKHNGKNGMSVKSKDCVDSERVIAITLLQQPRL